MDIKEIIIVLGIVIILVLVFGIGVFVGQERANFSFKWAQEYHKNFGGPASGFMGQLPGADFASANGVFGQIIKIDLPIDLKDQGSLTIRSIDGTEQVILVSSNTTIRTQRKNLKLADFKIYDNIVVIGSPNASGQIQAELIRVMPQILTK